MSGAADVAALFRRMADRIEASDETEFGGALVAVPPLEQNGQLEAIEILLIDPRRDPANYYAMTRSKVEIAASVFEERARARTTQGFR